ncbi:uncharacterized protein L969DRAFT_54148 [Mixia osmundae IAM 14324]|uniref:F-box domain-containing protein n=1 Tax=Mixia osmundae (strain CBS 9802 / IAM 14324 / JCM 22182 / KY 12970) TaxID=764103 RepID=G7E2L8_MIXOS|nr:uncharacterized protein L969DRAFT_54148 [Mixia osmundae IAM 14324]KEI36944.1 hypothetical protein L969DRAFT_54148 [Mixia osmundae IAM 14324]GAA97078.1 hypothetical protein E5Q_03753 [Mixia osmundae IAM 14324]
MLTNLRGASVNLRFRYSHTLGDSQPEESLETNKTVLADKSDEARLACLFVWAAIIPRKVFIDIISEAARCFLLDQFTWPPLREREWLEIVRRRFTRHQYRQYLALATPRDPARAFFARQLRSMQDGAVDGPMVHFMILHRKDRLTLNRIASRQFHPADIFEAMRRQTNLAARQTVVITLDDTRPDFTIEAHFTYGSRDSFMFNPHAGSLLSQSRSVIQTHGVGKSPHCQPLGDVLIYGRIRPSGRPANTIQSRALSICSADVFCLVPDLSDQVKVENGFGFL